MRSGIYKSISARKTLRSIIFAKVYTTSKGIKDKNRASSCVFGRGINGQFYFNPPTHPPYRALFTRLIYEDEDVFKFIKDNLSLFSDIAAEIAKNSGNASLAYYKGAGNNTSRVVAAALKIVRWWGGARIRATNELPNKLMELGLNEKMVKLLSEGAHEAQEELLEGKSGIIEALH